MLQVSMVLSGVSCGSSDSEQGDRPDRPGQSEVIDLEQQSSGNPETLSPDALNPITIDGNNSSLGTAIAAPNLHVNQNVVNVYGEPNIDGEIVTQALHGEPITVKQQQGKWLQVELPDQFNYRGWLKSNQVNSVQSELDQTRSQYIVAEFDTTVLTNPDPNSKVIERLTMGTIVYGQSDRDHPNFAKVQLVNGQQGYAPIATLQPFLSPKAPPPTSTALLATATKLLNQPYLWGGMSSDGVDCSGFIHTVFKIHGIKLHRDVDLQFEYDGVAIESPEH
ncbi:MAG: C40 family peptidase [Synechococcaceae cyanobacterium RL_1_2]|nr:C40 family peptidase [Synechococcaceae cyanobacterium RL_1_2]